MTTHNNYDIIAAWCPISSLTVQDNEAHTIINVAGTIRIQATQYSIINFAVVIENVSKDLFFLLQDTNSSVHVKNIYICEGFSKQYIYIYI